MKHIILTLLLMSNIALASDPYDAEFCRRTAMISDFLSRADDDLLHSEIERMKAPGAAESEPGLNMMVVEGIYYRLYARERNISEEYAFLNVYASCVNYREKTWDTYGTRD